MASSSSPARPDPQWVILDRIALLRHSVDAVAELSVAVAKPPYASTLTVPTSALTGTTDEDGTVQERYVVVAAADAAASALLLHVSSTPFIGVDLDCDRPGTLLVASGFSPADASRGAYTTNAVVRVPDRTHLDGHIVTSSCLRSLGLISLPGSGGTDYMVADLRVLDSSLDDILIEHGIIDGDAEKSVFSLLSFRSGTEAWVQRDLSCPGLSFLWFPQDVIAHKGKLWWVNFEFGMVGCDVFSDAPVVDHVLLPHTLTVDKFNIKSKGGILNVSGDKLCYVEIACAHPPDKTVVAVWSLVDGVPRWEQQYATTLGSIWSNHSYHQSKMPEEVPVIAFLHPLDPDVAFFFLRQFVFSIRLSESRVTGYIDDSALVNILSGNKLVQPSCWRHIFTWELPSWPPTELEDLSIPFDDLIAILNSPNDGHQTEQVGSDAIPINQPDHSMFFMRLPNPFRFDQALEKSTHYSYVTALELLGKVKRQDRLKWLSRHTAYAFLANGHLFLRDKVTDEVGRDDGCIAVITHQQLCQLEVDYHAYTTTSRQLKERQLKENEDSRIDRFEIRGNLWTRRRICLKDNGNFHILQWRVTCNKEQQNVKSTPRATLDDILNGIVELTAATKEIAASQKLPAESIRASHDAAAASNVALTESLKELSASHKTLMEKLSTICSNKNDVNRNAC